MRKKKVKIAWTKNCSVFTTWKSKKPNKKCAYSYIYLLS